jgi:hypothetical protein
MMEREKSTLSNRRWWIALAFALRVLARLDADAQTSAPVVDAPVVAVYESGAPAVSAISMTGWNFGWPTTSSGNYVRVVSAGSTYTVRAADPGVVLWHPDRIVVRLSALVMNGTVQVGTVAGQQTLTSAATAIDRVFALDAFNLAAYPSAVAVDPSGRAFVNHAFQSSLSVIDTSNTVHTYAIPLPADGGPFASTLNFFGSSQVDYATSMSVTGDGIAVDSGGNVWFTKGGQSPYDGVHPNHSRIIRFDPGKKKFRVYDLPGDNSQVSALAFVSGRIWYATGAHDVENYVENGQPVVVRAHVPAKIVSFDPSRVPFSDGLSIDYSRTSLSRVCAVGSRDTSCYHEYPIPDSCTLDADGSAECSRGGWLPTRPSSLLVARTDGLVWYADHGGPLLRTLLWGSWYVMPSPGNNVIGRVQPTSTVTVVPAIDLFPLATPIAGGRPGTLAEAANGDIAVSEQLDNTLSFLRRAAVLGSGASCTRLAQNNKNPCMSEAFVPDFSYMDSDGTMHLATNGPTVDPGQGEGVFGVGYDGGGNLWFTQTGPNQPDRLPSLGYVTPDRAKVVRLPPLGVFPGKAAYSGLGMTVDQNGSVWFADFLRQQVGRLRKVL